MPNISIAQAKIKFLELIELPRSANTLQTYRKALETFSNMLATQQIEPLNFPVAELSENSIVHFVDYMKDLSPATESLYLQVIKSFFEFLDAEQLSTINLSRVRMLIRQRIRRSRHQSLQYPEEDIRLLIEFMSNLQNVSSLDGNELDNPELRNLRHLAIEL